MPPVDTADQSGSTATATTEETAGATASVEKSADESAPDSAPEKKSPEDDSTRTERRNARRMSRLMDDRARAEAKAEALERENAQLKQSRAPDVSAGKPKLETFVKSGKYTTWEEAEEAYQDARDAWKDSQTKAKVEEERFEQAKAATAQAFKKSIKTFEKANPAIDMDDIVRNVASEMRANPMVEHFVLTADNPASLFHYLSENPDDLEALLDLPDHRIERHIGKLEDKIASGVKPQPKPLPKPPANVNAATATSFANLDEAQRDAAKRGDTKRWQQIEDEKRRQKRG